MNLWKLCFQNRTKNEMIYIYMLTFSINSKTDVLTLFSLKTTIEKWPAADGIMQCEAIELCN